MNFEQNYDYLLNFPLFVSIILKVLFTYKSKCFIRSIQFASHFAAPRNLTPGQQHHFPPHHLHPWFHSFLTSEVERDEWSASRSVSSAPGENAGAY
jgi:hypothetical protein